MSINKEKLKVIDRDTMKCLALFIMFWGHLFAWLTLLRHPEIDIAYRVMPMWQQILSHASIICPPTMFFFVADGYKYTRDRKKYAQRLLLFALITQPFDYLVFFSRYGWQNTNVIFSLFAGLLCIMAWESDKKKWQRVLIITLICLATLLIMADWFIFGCLYILFLHIYRDDPKKRFIAYLSITLVWKLLSFIGAESFLVALLDNSLDFLFAMAAYLCMTVFYNGKKGKHPVFAKWFFYIFYPVHYLIVYLVFILTK